MRDERGNAGKLGHWNVSDDSIFSYCSKIINSKQHGLCPRGVGV